MVNIIRIDVSIQFVGSVYGPDLGMSTTIAFSGSFDKFFRENSKFKMYVSC